MSPSSAGGRLGAAQAACLAILALALVLGPFGMRASSAGTKASRGDLRIGPAAEVVGPRIRLAEIGRLAGSARAFADLDLGAAPPPGDARRVSGHAVLSALEAAGADLDRITYRIPASVRVERAWQHPDPVVLEDAVVSAILGQLGEHEAIEAISLAQPVRLPRGHWRMVVREVERKSPAELKVTVEALEGERLIARFAVRVRLHVVGEVLRVTRTIPKGALVTEEHLEVVREALGDVPRDALRELADAIGKRARRSLRVGQYLPEPAVETAPLVERGGVVELEVVRGSLRMRERGRALEDGAAGETVRLVNLRSGRQLVGEVKGEGRVRIAW